MAMAPRSLTDAESRYSDIERECLAVMFGLEKFEFYLLGRYTLIETDHSPLEQIFKKKKHRRSSCTTAKTSLEMPEIDIEVVTRVSKEGRTYPSESEKRVVQP